MSSHEINIQLVIEELEKKANSLSESNQRNHSIMASLLTEAKQIGIQIQKLEELAQSYRFAASQLRNAMEIENPPPENPALTGDPFGDVD